MIVTGTGIGVGASVNAAPSSTIGSVITLTVANGGTVSGTLTPNSSAGTIYQYTLNGNITINSLGNAIAGTSMTLVLTQDGTGSRALTSTMKFAQGISSLSTTPSATDVMSVFYDGSTYYATLSRGFV